MVGARGGRGKKERGGGRRRHPRLTKPLMETGSLRYMLALRQRARTSMGAWHSPMLGVWAKAGQSPWQGSVLQAEGRSDADRGLQQALRASPHPPGGTALEASAGRRAPLYSRPRPRSAPTRVSPSKAAPQGRGRTPVAPPVTAASPLLPRSGSSLAQCVNASPAGRPGRGLLAGPISPGHSGTRSGGVRPHLRDLPFHGTRRLPLRTPEHPPQRLQAPMQSRPLRSRSFKRAPCSAPGAWVCLFIYEDTLCTVLGERMEVSFLKRRRLLVGPLLLLEERHTKNKIYWQVVEIVILDNREGNISTLLDIRERKWMDSLESAAKRLNDENDL
ncbi:hypothetical protein NDU88_002626 [Pleurodeles waltl]|uniref:Uncharacterized protein n=1 Tax=Pleurodeles waltl TaxID=8319 RepID=A0AAV7U9T2_PLEWA|nr:hypothetical protein NDU88_002626 [Pleurodeles waltl]